MHVEKGRVGQYFLFVGILLLVIFFSTEPGAEPVVGYFLSGVGLVILGLYLIRRDWKAPPPSGRFRLLRRLRRQPKEKKYE
jgi:hypothetical protein